MADVIQRAIQNTINTVFRSGSLENPSTSINDWIQGISGTRTNSGQVVTPETAKTISAVYACVRVISETIASLPFEVLENEGVNTNVASDHYLYRIVNREPSHLYTSFTFIETMIAVAELKGNAKAQILSSGSGRVTELRILDHDKWKTELREVGNREEIVHVNREGNEVLMDYEVLHIKAPSFSNGVEGESTIKTLRETVGEAMAALEFGTHFFSNGGRLTGALETDKTITEDTQKRLLTSWHNKYHGNDAQYSVAILEEGMKFKEISLSPQEAQFIETRKFSIEEIARAYRVPLHMLQSLDRATNNNIEQQSIDFVTHSIRPRIKRIEHEFNRKLFLEREKGRYYVRFNMNALLRGDSQSRAEFYSKLFNIGAMSQNDIRRRENENPVPGGDVYLTPHNLINRDNPEEMNKINPQENGET